MIPVLGYEGYASKVELSYKGDVTDDYRMLSGKRLHCTNQAREYEAKLSENLRLVLRLYDNGIAFRYVFSGLRNQVLPKEQISFLRERSAGCNSGRKLMKVSSL